MFPPRRQIVFPFFPATGLMNKAHAGIKRTGALSLQMDWGGHSVEIISYRPQVVNVNELEKIV